MSCCTGCRSCRKHLTNNVFANEAITKLKLTSAGFVSMNEVQPLLLYAANALRECSVSSFTFDSPLTELQMFTFTGLTCVQFSMMLESLPLRNGPTWSARNALGIYLMKLRTGERNQ